jgi:DNA polymerase III alpha subunit
MTTAIKHTFTNLRCRTEFSFGEVYGPIEKVLAATSGPVGICDRSGTWGHAAFAKACKEAKRKAIFGVELAVVPDKKLKEKQGTNFMNFIARDDAGLRELYELVTLATEQDNFYYMPRLDYGDLSALSEHVIILSGSTPVWGNLPRHRNLFIELNPTSVKQAAVYAKEKGFKTVCASDNYFPTPEDREAYDIIAGRNRVMRTSPMHLLTEWEWRNIWPDQEQAIRTMGELAAECTAVLPKASIIHFDNMKPIEQMCRDAAKSRGVNLKNKVYNDRLKREIAMIKEKEFDDYFYLVYDMIHWAKQHMLVGPARGSSCGSLVCYLLGITEIDPIPYSLLFERFIDINRKDLPDIDIDFPDDRRDLVFEYLHKTYGSDRVTRLGTVMRYKAKSTIDEVSKALQIPSWEVTDLKGAIIERSGGDARATFCILDTFEQLEIGKKMIEKYPQLKIASKIENHIKSNGQHAAGIVVTADPVSRYCAIDLKKQTAMIDKHDAETLNLLKIDALGLRTLSVLQDCLDQVKWSREKLINYPTNDAGAFKVLNEGRFSGIFQFEGYALQSLCKGLVVENFEDIASLTALARPGPLNSGGATEFLRRRTGKSTAMPLHPSIAHITNITHGIVIYQEQVMQIAREMGKLSWEDVSSLRKAMSKSLGKEFFDSYWERFKEGALSQKVKLDDAQRVWENINTMGSWSFNRSHAVAYGLVSYWCLVLKNQFPLEWAASCLRNARDDDQGIRLLREIHKEGYHYKAFDAKLSVKNWSVQDGVLLGGLLSVKGIGGKTADDIVQRRTAGLELTAGQKSKIANAATPFDVIFECEEKWGHIKRNPEKFNILSRLWELDEITEETSDEVCCIVKLREKNLRDHNELSGIQKRGGKRMAGQTFFLNMTFEDDTGAIPAGIDRHKYLEWGVPIVEDGRIGDWYIIKGKVRAGFRKIYIERWRKLM